MANLFDKNKFFLELLDLKISHQLSEGASTLITENGRVFIIGGSISKYVYELEEKESILMQKAQIP